MKKSSLIKKILTWKDVEAFTEQELALVYTGQQQTYKNACLAYDERHYSEKYDQKGNDM